MWINEWWKWLNGRARKAGGRRQRARGEAGRPRGRARLHLEALEDRCVPSTITVTTTTDVVNITTTDTIDQVNASPPAGGISLRDAVIAADNTPINGGNPSNTINLPAGTYNLTLTGQATDSGDGSDLLIAANQNIILNGTGTPANTTINQTVAGTRIFETQAPATPATPTNITFAIDNVTFNNGQGQAFGGGAILAGGIGNSLTLGNCAFTNNQSSNPGGAIENFGGGSLTVTGCTFSNNMTTAGGGGGGAIDFSSDTTQPGSLTVVGSTFDTNTATDAAGGGGGAIQASAGSGTVSITISNFVNNKVVSSGVGGSEGSGGAIYHDLGAATVQDNRFFNNSAEVAANGNTLFQQVESPAVSFNANDNWWGQNTGPAANDLAGGTITASTHLQLEITPTSATLTPTQTQLFTADIRKSSGGGQVDLTGLPAFPTPAATIVSHTTPATGSFQSADTQFTNGTATATYQALLVGTDTVKAAVDNQNVSAAVMVNALADLTITKTDDHGGDSSTATAGSVVSGTQLVYTITVSNTGPDDAPGTMVADTFPAGFTGATFTATAAGGATFANGTGSESGSGDLSDTVSLPSGGSVTYTVTGTVAPSATGTLSNNATVTAGPGVTDPTPGNNSATDTDNLTQSADLSATTTGPATIAAGQDVTYTLTFHNAGPSDAQATLLTVDVPNNTTFVSIHQDSGPPLGGTVAPGGTATFTFVAHVDANTPDGTQLVNKVTASSTTSDPTPGNNSDSATTTVHPQADLTITKSDDRGGNSGGTAGTVVPGAALTYTITVSNTGPSDAPGTVVADTFPAGFTGATFTATAAGGATFANGTGSESGSGDLNDTVSLPAGGSVTYTVTGTVAPSATGMLSNTATVTPGAGVTDPTPANNSATDTDNLTPQAELSVTKDDGKTSAVPGTADTYTITVSNAGPSTVSSVTLNDAVPAALLNPVFGTPSAGSYDPATGVWSGLSLATGQSVTITLTGTIDPAASGSLTNTATVAPPAGVTDPTPANNSATDTDNLTPTADLTITKKDAHGGDSTTATAGTVVPGMALTYTITVSNTGPSDAPGTKVADLFPAGFTGATFTATAAGGATFANGTGSESGSGDLSDTVSLPAGGSVTYTVTGTVAPSATGMLSNTATVTPGAGVTDPTPANNSATDTDNLTPTADLVVTQTGSPNPTEGQTVTLTITIVNNGPSDAANVMLTDALPVGMAFVSSSFAGYSATTNTVNLGTIADGASVMGTITVIPTDEGQVSNTASVTSDAIDHNLANNSSTLPVTVADAALTASPTTVTATEGTGTGAVPVATFTDANPGATTADFSGTIDWGDGTTTPFTSADVTLGGGTFTVTGSHTYADEGTFSPGSGHPVHVFIQDNGGSTATADSTANVAEAQLNPPTGGFTFTATEGTLSTVQTLATFTDPGDPNGTVEPLTDYVVQVDWGNGIFVSNDPKVSLTRSGGTFTVTGQHLYPGDDGFPGPVRVQVLHETATPITVTVPLTLLPVAPTVTITGAPASSPAGVTIALGSTVSDGVDPAADGPYTYAWTVTRNGTFFTSGNGASLSFTPTDGSYGVSLTATDKDGLRGTASQAINVTPQGDLSVTVSEGLTTAPGTAVRYTLVVGNSGPSTATGALLVDNLPAALTGAVFTSTVTTGTASGNTASGSGNLRDTLTLGPNSTITYTITATIVPTATGILNNTATVTAPAGFTDTNPANNTATATNPLVAQPALVFVNPAFTGPAGTTPAGAAPGTVIGFNAFPTIQQGLNAVAGGGTVVVAAATYTETLVVSRSVILQGAGSGTTIVTGTATPGGQHLGIGLDVTTASGVVVSGLTVRNFHDGLVAGSATTFLSLTDVLLTGNDFGGGVNGVTAVLFSGGGDNDTLFVTATAVAQLAGKAATRSDPLSYSKVKFLTVDGGGGSNTLFVFLIDSTLPDRTWVDAAAVARDNVPFLVFYRASGGSFGGGVTVVLGGNGQTAVVQGQLAGAPTRVVANGGDAVFVVAVTTSSAYANLTLDGGGGSVGHPDNVAIFDLSGGGSAHTQALADGTVEFDVSYGGSVSSRIHEQNVEETLSNMMVTF